MTRFPAWLRLIPLPPRRVLQQARLFKVIDKLEAVIQHNESPISTWEALEYQLQREYGQREAKWFPQTAALREAILRQTEEKIAAEGERELGQMALEV